MQLNAWKKMRKLLGNDTESDRKYNEHLGSKSGKIISTDIARMMDDRFAKKPALGKLRDIEPSWDLAWRYAQDRMRREILARKSQKQVRFMAGGWAAGKTHAIENLPPGEPPDLTWDGTLKDTFWATKTIDLALEEGWKVEIVYIYRNIELALYGAVERRDKEGRAVPLDELAANHRDVQQAILDLYLLYLGKTNVSFLFLHNFGKNEHLNDALKIDIKELELHGALHYLERHEEYYSTAAKHLERTHKG